MEGGIPQTVEADAPAFAFGIGERYRLEEVAPGPIERRWLPAVSLQRGGFALSSWLATSRCLQESGCGPGASPPRCRRAWEAFVGFLSSLVPVWPPRQHPERCNSLCRREGKRASRCRALRGDYGATDPQDLRRAAPSISNLRCPLLTWQSAKKALMTPFYRRLCRGQRDSRRCSFQLRPTEQVDPSGFCAPTERENAELWERGCSGCGAAIPNSCAYLKECGECRIARLTRRQK